jgi:hypothetical protein
MSIATGQEDYSLEKGPGALLQAVRRLREAGGSDQREGGTDRPAQLGHRRVNLCDDPPG